MNKRIAFLVLLLALPVYTAANPTVIPVKIENPASTFCEDQEFILEIGTAADGSQSGVCVFLDGSECDEWVCYRGDCGPGTVVPSFTPQRTDGRTTSTIPLFQRMAVLTFERVGSGF